MYLPTPWRPNRASLSPGYGLPVTNANRLRWKVKVEGRSDDLQPMSECFTDPSCRIERGEDGFYLTSTGFDSSIEASAHLPPSSRLSDAAYSVELSARQLLGIVNGAFFLAFRCHEGVTMSRIHGTFHDGRPGIVVHIGGGSSLKIWTPDAPTFSENVARWMECAIDFVEVAEALTMYGAETALTAERAHQLYNVYEIIRHDVPGRDLKAKGWAPSSEIDICRRSLNLARHSRPSGRPPEKPMPLAKCHSLIRVLLVAWIEEKMSL